MEVNSFQRIARNITAALVHVDPTEAFPEPSQSERRIRFQDNPHAEFLRCTDDEQLRISEMLMKTLGPQILNLCVLFEDDTRRQMSV